MPALNALGEYNIRSNISITVIDNRLYTIPGTFPAEVLLAPNGTQLTVRYFLTSRLVVHSAVPSGHKNS